MGLLDEKAEMWKKAKEKADAMDEKHKAVVEASKAAATAKTEDEAKAASEQMRAAYKEYRDEAGKSTGLFDKVLKWLGLKS